VVALVLATALLAPALAGCGSRLSDSNLLAQARDSVGTGTGDVPAGVVDSGTSPLPGAPIPVPSGGTDVAGPVTTDPASVGAASGAAPDGSAQVGASPSRPGVAGSVKTTTARCSGTADPIILGTVGQQSGIPGQYFGPGVAAVQAWVAYTNATGGLNCHPIRYIVADDASDPAKSQAAVKRLVEQEHVIAFLYQDDVLTGSATVAYIQQKGIPVIGGIGANDTAVYQSPMRFQQHSSGEDFLRSAFAGVTVGKKQGLTNVATVSCIESQICSTLYDLAEKYGREFGVKVVARNQVSLTQPSFTSICQAQKAAGAQMVLIGADGSMGIRLAQSCASVNFHPLLVLFGATTSVSSMSSSWLVGSALGSPVMPYQTVSNPGVALFREVMAKYAPGATLAGSSMSGWVAAQLFRIATAKHIPSTGPVTTAQILAGLYTIKNNDVGGMTSPLTFSAGQPAKVQFCYWSSVIGEGGALKPGPNGPGRTCA
jgi:branched-chain amino acid transport system substrate-binding protein